MRILYIVCLIFLLNIVSKSCDTELENDFILYEKDAKTGKVEIATWRTKKGLTDSKNKNILSLQVDTELNQNVGYCRYFGSVWDFDTYACGGATIDLIGSGGVKNLNGGVLLTF